MENVNVSIEIESNSPAKKNDIPEVWILTEGRPRLQNIEKCYPGMTQDEVYMSLKPNHPMKQKADRGPGYDFIEVIKAL